jgi:quinoprotein glucose dehydrogenase
MPPTDANAQDRVDRLRKRVAVSVIAATVLSFCAWIYRDQAAQASGTESPQTSAARTDWPTYNGEITGDHYSPLNQITTANVQQLKEVWRFKPVPTEV